MGPAQLTSMLLLADGRTPSGGHAHSAGVEAAVADGRVHDLASLEAFTEGRLRTTGFVDAALAACTVRHLEMAATAAEGGAVLLGLDHEADVRILAPPLRAASRRLGRQLVRVAARCWPSATLAGAVDIRPDGLHQSVALGAVALSAGIDEAGAAALVLHHALTTPTQAALKLLGLDPFEVAALVVRLGPVSSTLLAAARVAAAGALGDLPAASSPLCEIAAVEHHRWPVRMFAT